MDNHTLRVLEFDKVLLMASEWAVTVPGRHLTEMLLPQASRDDAAGRIELVSSCRRFFAEGRHLGIEPFGDITYLFRKVRPRDAILEAGELTQLLPLLSSASFLAALEDDPLFAGLSSLVSGLSVNRQLKENIERSVDHEGKLKDDASAELASIRRRLRSCKKRISSALEDILGDRDLEVHLQDFFIAERNSRWVIPVKIDSKGSVPGVVHDISNTGETVYIEPYVIQKAGNELEALKAEEKVEEFRILREFSRTVRDNLDTLEEDYRIVAQIDSLQAVAKFADSMQMEPPEITEGYVKIAAGRHPLLWKTLKKNDRETELVPLDVSLGQEAVCMVITGSNAGGKTVALKTVGVLCLMALSGMHVPAGSGTSIPYLEQLFADIGDEQSIEENLSTFSAHMQRIADIVRKSGRRALVLIDELGTGTDPEQGGALSCAILRRLKKAGALAIVSTHLGMLKAFAHAETDVVNGAMQMEEVQESSVSHSFRPTYKLLLGEPGTSHALEIARSLGIDDELIDDARTFISEENAAIENLIAELKDKAQKAEQKLEEAARIKEEAENIRSRLLNESAGLEHKRKTVMAEAYGEAEKIISKFRREAMEFMSSLKKAPSTVRKKLIRSAETRQSEISRMKKSCAPEERKRLQRIEAGQMAFIPILGSNGTISEVNERAQRCRVVAGGKEVTLPFSDIFEPDAETAEKEGASGAGNAAAAYAPNMLDTSVARELNLIGVRVDPALSRIERFLNDASLAGIGQVKIIHGYGTGVLSRAVREFLADHPIVESQRPGEEEEGGEAVTIVYL